MTRSLVTSFLVVMTAVACKTAGNGGAAGVKIAGGEAVEREDPRFLPVVQLADKTGAMCTATFVTPNHILTAAHCISDAPGGNIRGFNFPRFAAPQRIYTQGIAGAANVKPLIHTPDAYKDAVILGFDTPSTVGSIPVCSHVAAVGESVYMTGYGPTFVGGDDGMKRFAEIAITEIDSTRGLIIVAGGKTSIIPGDSGGPLISVAKNCVLGVASFIEGQDMITSNYVDLTTPKLQSFLASHGVTGNAVVQPPNPGSPDAGDGSDAGVPPPANPSPGEAGPVTLKGRRCTADDDSGRTLTFTSDQGVNDTTGGQVSSLVYQIQAQTLTIRHFQRTETFDILDSGNTLRLNDSASGALTFRCE